MKVLIDNLEIETWTSVRGFEGLYEVSNFGRVKSLSRIVMCKNGISKPIKERILKPQLYPNGYQFVNLSSNGRAVAHLLHRIVALSFLGYSSKEVNHKDGNKTNNFLGNLEYVTHSENQKHLYRVLKNPPVKSWLGKKGFLHNKSIHVKIENVNTGFTKIFGSYRIAQENGFSRSVIKEFIDTGRIYRNTLKFTHYD